MSNENPWAYNEARNRINENKEREKIIIEEKKENFEKTKERIKSRKKLDVFELKRKFETGNSLSILKSDIKEALDRGDISIETYTNVITELNRGKEKVKTLATSGFILDPKAFPFSDTALSIFFDKQRLGDNLLIDLGGFVYGFVQGSVFLLFLFGRIILDTLLLPIDLYKMTKK